MKNFQKIALSLMIVGLAFGFSAFTNTKHVSTKNKTFSVSFDFLVQRAGGQFTQVDPSDNSAEPETSACFSTAARRCAYEVTTSGHTNIPSLSTLGQTYYTQTQIDTYVTSGWLISASSSNALYAL